VGWVALTLRFFMRTSWAVAGSLVLAFGTSAWNVASSQLWQHGPAMMWIALGGYLIASSRYWTSGFAYGAAIVTRPITAIIAAGAGIGAAAGDRRWRRLMQIGTGAAIGLAAVIAYNAIVFGSPSVSGGYGDAFVDSTLSSGIGWYVGNLVGALIDPRRGLLVWSPWLLVLAPGLRTAWKSAPGWSRGAAIGALVYLLVHYKANRFSGGDGFYGYRYPIEPLTAAAPLLALAYRDWVVRRPWALRIFTLAVVAAIALQVVAALR
jgi:alpha-1,2-mannosyltransferase